MTCHQRESSSKRDLSVLSGGSWRLRKSSQPSQSSSTQTLTICKRGSGEFFADRFELLELSDAGGIFQRPKYDQDCFSFKMPRPGTVGVDGVSIRPESSNNRSH